MLREEAQEAMTVAMASYYTGRMATSGDKITLIDFLRCYLKDREIERGWSINTIAGNENIINNHIAKDPIGSKLVSKLKYADIKSYYINQMNDGLGNNTLRRHQAILRPALDEAVISDLLATNPARLYSKLKRPEQFVSEIYDVDQVNRMLEAFLNDPIYPCVLLGIQTAGRRGEVLGATWSDIDFNKATFRISKAYYSVNGQTGYFPVKTHASNDTVCISDDTVSELERIKAEQEEQKKKLGKAYEDHNLICCQANGTPWEPTTISHAFRDKLIKYGLPPIRFYDLRHSHATILYEECGDIHMVMRQLRHATIQMASKRYTHDTLKIKRKANNFFNRALHKRIDD
jgi:integrase